MQNARKTQTPDSVRWSAWLGDRRAVDNDQHPYKPIEVMRNQSSTAALIGRPRHRVKCLAREKEGPRCGRGTATKAKNASKPLQTGPMPRAMEAAKKLRSRQATPKKTKFRATTIVANTNPNNGVVRDGGFCMNELVMRPKSPNELKLSDGGWRRKSLNTEKAPPPASVRWSALLGGAGRVMKPAETRADNKRDDADGRSEQVALAETSKYKNNDPPARAYRVVCGNDEILVRPEKKWSDGWTEDWSEQNQSARDEQRQQEHKHCADRCENPVDE